LAMATRSSRRTPRDLLPLPVGQDLDIVIERLRLEQGASSRRRRLHETEKGDAWLAEGIGALNTLGGRGQRFQAERPSEAQFAAIDRLRGHYQYVSRLLDLPDPGEAWRELVHAKSGYAPEAGALGVGSAGKVATYREGAVKLPSVPRSSSSSGLSST
jgi:hypothetical protein